MRTIKQLEALINAGRITEKEAISYIIDFYGNEEDNMGNFPVNEEYCTVESYNGNQSVNYGDYTCSGDIVDFWWWHINFYKEAEANEAGVLECKIFHTNLYTFVDGGIVIIRLYDTLKESDL